jgi:hypothetical protein
MEKWDRLNQSQFWSDFLSSLYLVLGVWGAHLLHIARFRLVRWSHISAFPDYRISLEAAFWWSFLLFPILTGAAIILHRRPRLLFVIAFFTVTEMVSQTFGRSMMKLVIDIGLWSIIVWNHIIVKFYGREVVGHVTRKELPIFHSEVLTILKITVQICMFIIGTLGITVASQVLSRYFSGELGQGTAWCYVSSMLYLALGMICLLIVPLFKSLLIAREKIGGER